MRTAKNLRFHRTILMVGVICLGGPVGTSAYTTEYVRKKVISWIENIELKYRKLLLTFFITASTRNLPICLVSFRGI